MTKAGDGKSYVLSIVAFIVAYTGSRLIFHFAGFDYNLLTDPFNGAKILIDVAVFAGFFFASYFIFRKLF